MNLLPSPTTWKTIAYTLVVIGLINNFDVARPIKKALNF